MRRPRIGNWLRDGRARALALAMLCALGGWGFLEIADEVAEDEAKRIDEAILLSLREPGDTADPLGPIWLEEAARDITALGSFAVLLIVTAVTAAWLVVTNKRSGAVLFLCAVLTGVALSTLLKGAYARERPDLVAHQMHAFTASFPSGHSLLSALIYLSVGALFASTQPKLAVKAFILLFSVAIAGLVGISRIYLGVHWPTDVLAGWCAGAAWAILWGLIALRFLPRRETETSGMEADPLATVSRR